MNRCKNSEGKKEQWKHSTTHENGDRDTRERERLSKVMRTTRMGEKGGVIGGEIIALVLVILLGAGEQSLRIIDICLRK